MTRTAKTRPFSKALYALVLIGGVASGDHIEFGARALAQNIKPEPMPLPPSEFPTPRADLEALMRATMSSRFASIPGCFGRD